MRSILAIWKDWKGSDRVLLFLLALLMLTAMGFFAFNMALGTEAVLGWQKNGSLSNFPVVIDIIDALDFEFRTESVSFLYTERFDPTPFKVRAYVYPLYVGLILAGMIGLLTAATKLKNTLWYGVGLAVLTLYIGTLKFEELTFAGEMLSGTGNVDRSMLLLTLGALVPLSFIFKTVLDKKIAPLWRFLLFALILIPLGWFLEYKYSAEGHGLIHVANFGFFIPLLISLIFIVLTAHEIVRGFLHITTSEHGLATKGNFRHFVGISCFYFLNLILVYLSGKGVVGKGIFLVSPFLLVMLSLVFGVWGMKGRESLYEKLMDFQPAGAILYFSGAIITFATLGFAIAVGDDGLTDALHDFILYTHFAFGLIYVFYIMYNFYPLFKDGYQVHKVQWQGRQMGYMTASLFACLIIVILESQVGYRHYDQTMAAYNNGLADTYKARGLDMVSEGYRTVAQQYDVYNHKANYITGELFVSKGYDRESRGFFNRASEARPTPQSFDYLVKVNAKSRNFLETTYKSAMALYEFPNNDKLLNNFAFEMMQLDEQKYADSVFRTLQKAIEVSKEPQTAQANFYSLWTLYNLRGTPDSLMPDPESYIPTLNNELMFANRINDFKPRSLQKNLIADTTLRTDELCYLYNFALNQAKNYDTTGTTDYIKSFEKRISNYDFEEFLAFARAVMLYHQGETREAFFTLQYVKREYGRFKPLYAHVLGTWLIEHKQYAEAAKAFKDAFMAGKREEDLNWAIALSQLEDKSRSLDFWTKWDEAEGHAYDPVTSKMIRILHPDSVRNIPMTERGEQERVNFIHYRNPYLSEEEFTEIIEGIENSSLKLLAVLERVEYLVEQDDLKTALLYRNDITGAVGMNEEVRRKLDLLDLKLLYRSGRTDELAEKLKTFEAYRTDRGRKVLYEAVTLAGKNSAVAEKKFIEAYNRLPYEPETYILASDFYLKQGKKTEGYETLLKGIEFIPKSAEIHKAYVRTCIELSYFHYVDDGMETLYDLMPAKDYLNFAAEVDSLKKAKSPATGEWESDE